MSRTLTISFITYCLLTSSAVYAATALKEKVAKSSKSVHKARRAIVKTSPVTDEGDAWTANIETDIYRTGSFENVLVGYSTSNGWDFSLSLVNSQILGPNKHFQGDTFLSIAKTFAITDDFSLVLGSQGGFTAVNTKPRSWFNYNFLDARYDVIPELSVHAGPYMANKALTGTVRRVGYLTGAEITFIPNQLALQMDYFHGIQIAAMSEKVLIRYISKLLMTVILSILLI